MVKLGLLGVGHLGKIHLKCLKSTEFKLIGIYDPLLDQTSYEGHKVYTSEDKLIQDVDACIVASTTTSHYDLVCKILAAHKHCFVEKPMTSTLEQAHKLYTIAHQNPQLITQVGFVERYNPAYKFISEDITNPKFIEVHRLSMFNNRGNDVSVVYDLMIHDLDLLLSMKSCGVKEVKATGVKIVTDSMDICNARIEFEDNSVANLTASRMSMKVMRKFRIFQGDRYLSMDLGKKESQVIKMMDQPSEGSMAFPIADKTKHLVIKSSGTLEGNAIVDEQRDFYRSIVNNKQPKVNFENAYNTTLLAHKIEDLAKNSLT